MIRISNNFFSKKINCIEKIEEKSSRIASHKTDKMWAWEHIPVIPALGNWKKEHPQLYAEFKDSRDYVRL